LYNLERIFKKPTGSHGQLEIVLGFFIGHLLSTYTAILIVTKKTENSESHGIREHIF
jgi:hypothetical protein